jgi:hypothetical protein
MDKKAIDINPSVVSRYAAGGLLTGAGGAAALSLVRMLREMRLKQQAAEPETDENTIVLTLPRKTAEVTTKRPTTPKVVPAIKRSTIKGKGNQPRRPDCTFGPSLKYATAWPSLSAGWLAGLAGTAAGAHLVNRVYQRHREKVLQTDLDAARQEYLDALSGSQKTADFLGLPTFDQEKDASVTGMLNWPLAMATVLSILGAGGTGYVTKRVLDEQLRDSQSRGLDIPKANRIVFRSQPKPAASVPIDPDEEDEEKTASAQDIECIKAAVCVMVDRLDPNPGILTDPGVKQACDKAGVTRDELLKAAQDIDALLAHLQKSPELQTMITRASMEKHPVLKHFRWASKLPMIGKMMNNRSMGRLEQLLRPAASTIQPPRPQLMAPKVAMSGVLTSLIGSSIAERANAQQLPPAVEAKAPVAPRSVDSIQLDAEDPEAQAYMDKNKQQIKMLIEQLIQQGKL